MGKSSQACDHCHKRRIKCQFEPSVNKCLNCYRLAQNCTFHRVPQKRGPHRKRHSINTDHTATTAGISNNNYYSRSQSLSTDIISNIDNTISLESINTLPVQSTQHGLADILDVYYETVHPHLAILPTDSTVQFNNIILNNTSHLALKHLFHSIFESFFYSDDNEKLTNTSLYWTQLVTLHYNYPSPMDDCLYVLCHLLLCSMSHSYNSRILGHCIGAFNDISVNGTLPNEIKYRLLSVVKLIDLLNVKFTPSYHSMFTQLTFPLPPPPPANILELINLLNGDNSALPQTSLNEVWYHYHTVILTRQQFVHCIATKQSYIHITAALCGLINAMLKVLIHIDENKYTDSPLQLVKHHTHVYRFEYGLTLIVGKVTTLLHLVKDTPSFLINMVLLSSQDNNNNDIVTQLSNSMNELVQITTLTYKLGRNAPASASASASASTATPASMARSASLPLDNDLFANSTDSTVMLDFHNDSVESHGNSTPRHRLDQLSQLLQATA